MSATLPASGPPEPGDAETVGAARADPAPSLRLDPPRGVLERLRRFAGSPSVRAAGATFLVARLLGSIAAAVGLSGIPSEGIPSAMGYLPKPGSPLFNATIGLWERYDAIWYIRIAEGGYAAGNMGAALFPLFPLSIRALHALGLPALYAGLLIANVCFFLGLWFVHRLTLLDLDEPAAGRVVWLQALYPGCFFLLTPHTESLYFALSAGTIYAARTRRWWLAGIAGGALSATRNLGVLVGAALAVEFLLQRREVVKPRWRSALWLGLVPVGLCSFILYWQLKVGRPFEFLVQSRAWGRRVTPPWTTIAVAWQQTITSYDRYPHAVYLLEGGAAVALLYVAIRSVRILRPTYSVFLWLSIIPLVVNPVPSRMFCSLLRYSAVLFPASMTVAALVRRQTTQEALQVIFAGLFALCTALYVTSRWMF